MRELDHFFVLHGLAGLPPVEEVRRVAETVLPRKPWRLHAAGALLVGWQGGAEEARGPMLVHMGDPSGLPADLSTESLAAGSTREAARLDGAFAVLAFTPHTQCASLVTDRFGLMPLYAHEGAGWCHGTSLALVLALTGCLARLDVTAAYEMLALHMTLGGRTLIDGVRLVPPATVVTLGKDGLETRNYWDWQHFASPVSSGDTRDLVRETYGRIEQAILRAVPAGVKKVALPLSGGLDSRLLAAVLSRHGVPVQAYNIDFGHEAAIARRVANTLNLPLRELAMLDRPAAIPEAHRAVDGAYHVNQVWGWEMARQSAQDGCDVLFDGLAFDTILGAVFHVTGADMSALARNLEAYWTIGTEVTLARVMDAEAANRAYSVVRASVGEQVKEAIKRAGSRASDYFLMTNRIRKYTFGYCLANLHALPGRFPYITTALFEHCQGLPLKMRREHTLYRHIYRELFPDLAAIPWAKTMLPLDRYAPANSPRWQPLLAAVVRRLSRGRMSLSGRGSFESIFSRRRDLRALFDEVLGGGLIDGAFPPGTGTRAVHGLRTGKPFGEIVQGLYTVEHCLRLALGASRNWAQR